MKNKFLCFILAICLMIPCVFMLTACETEPQTVYTVTESEWEINFNITKTSQASPLSVNLSKSLEEITSYTLRAEGWAENGSFDEIDQGLGILKVAPNGMEMEFYINGELRTGESGKTPSSDPWYVGMTTMLKSYFPFSGRYNEFTYDEAKKAYVVENLKSTVVDESDITQTYDLYNKKAEVTFINGYLNTVTVEMCEDETYEHVYLSLVFTFSNINNTVVEI